MYQSFQRRVEILSATTPGGNAELEIRDPFMTRHIFSAFCRFMTNKKFLQSSVLTAVLTASAIPAMASGPGWTALSSVTSIVLLQSGGVAVRLSPDLSACTAASGYPATYAFLRADTAGLNRIYAALLSANMSDKKVQVYLSDATCLIGEVILGGL